MNRIDIDMTHETSAPIDMLEHYFNGNDWAYERDGDEEIVTTIRGSWSEYELRALWHEDDQVLQFIAMLGVNKGATLLDDGARHHLYEALSMVNEHLWIGHFEAWSADGALVFRHAALLDGAGSLSFSQAEALVNAAINECERYYPVFQFVLWGGKTAHEALASAMIETEGEA